MQIVLMADNIRCSLLFDALRSDASCYDMRHALVWVLAIGYVSRIKVLKVCCETYEKMREYWSNSFMNKNRHD